MAEAIRNWFAYHKAIWLKRKFTIHTVAGKSIADMRPCPTCGTKSLVLVSKLQAVLLCKKCKEVHIKKRAKKPAASVPAPAHEQKPLPMDSGLPECRCCDRQVETKRHKFCVVHKGWSAARKAEAIAIKANPDCK